MGRKGRGFGGGLFMQGPKDSTTKHDDEGKAMHWLYKA